MPRKVRCGIGVGEHDVGREAAAVVQADAARPAIGDVDLGDLGVGDDLDAVLAVERGDGAGDAAHAAA